MPEATTDSTSGRRSALLAGLGLTGLVLLCFPAVAWYFHARHGQGGLIAAGAAAVLCWVASLFALGVHSVCRAPRHAVPGALGATLVRTTFVFGTMIVLTAASPTLKAGGFAPAVVLYFLITLAAETALVLWVIRPTRSGSGKDNPQRSERAETA